MLSLAHYTRLGFHLNSKAHLSASLANFTRRGLLQPAIQAYCRRGLTQVSEFSSKMSASEGRHNLNRLAKAKSPYLLQHAENPVCFPPTNNSWRKWEYSLTSRFDRLNQVDWYEWGTEAFEKAKRENKPIFLSVSSNEGSYSRRTHVLLLSQVGYSACHCERNIEAYTLVSWTTVSGCHVLAHESFEDEVTAVLMNNHYVNIKVIEIRCSIQIWYTTQRFPQVDREERPDVDSLYMTYLQATAGGGGWPMSVCEYCRTYINMSVYDTV